MTRDPGGTIGRRVGVLFEAGPLGGLGDGALLERFATGPGEVAESAFAVLVDRHGGMVLRTCRGVLRDEHAAHDAFQATFLVLARSGRTFRARETIGPWLHGVAWRVASRARVAAGRRARHERRAAEMAARQADAPGRGPGRFSADDESALMDEVRRLPDRLRAVVVLCDLEGLTTDGAAARLGTPVGTARSRLARARDRLRDRLTRRGVAPAIVAGAAGIGEEATANGIVPAGLADRAVRTAIEWARAGTVPAGLAALIEGGHAAMNLKMMMTVGLVAGLVAGVGGLAAHGPGGGPGRGGPVQEKVTTPGVEVRRDDPAPVLADRKSDEAADGLIGRWALRTRTIGHMSKSGLQATLTFDAATLTWQGGTVGLPARYRYRRDLKPGASALLLSEGRGPVPADRPANDRMLYDLAGDRLRLAFSRETGKPDPTGFGDPSEHVSVLTLARIPATDVDTLLGSWDVRKVTVDGVTSESSEWAFGTITFDREMVYLDRLGQNHAPIPYRLAPASSPRAIRVGTVDQNGRGVPPSWWIFSVEGGRLRLAFDRPKGDPQRNYQADPPIRPKGFEPAPDQPKGHALVVLDLDRSADRSATAIAPGPLLGDMGDRDPLAGRWIVQKVRVNGAASDDSPFILGAIEFQPGRIRLELFGAGPETLDYRPAPGTSPRAIRVAAEASRGLGGGLRSFGGGLYSPSWWICARDGETLRVAFHLPDPPKDGTFSPRVIDPPRPTGFTAVPKEDAGYKLVVLDLARDPEPRPTSGGPVFGQPTPAPTTPAPAVASKGTTEPEPVADRERLQGSWTVVGYAVNGKPADDKGKMLMFRFVFGDEGGEIIGRDDKKDEVRYVVDPGGTPPAILVRPGGTGPGQAEDAPAWWLYAFDGDRLRLGIPGIATSGRPRGFDIFSAAEPLETLELIRTGPAGVRPAPAAGPKPDAVAEDLAKLQGTWSIIAEESGGAEVPFDAEARLTIVGNGLVAIDKRATAPEVHRFEIDPAASPKTITMTKPDGGPVVKGIYQINEPNGLTLCFDPSGGGVVPESFETAAGTARRLTVLRRKKPAAKEVKTPAAPPAVVRP